MTCRECENAPTRLCVACYEREQYGEQYPVPMPRDAVLRLAAANLEMQRRAQAGRIAFACGAFIRIS